MSVVYCPFCDEPHMGWVDFESMERHVVETHLEWVDTQKYECWCGSLFFKPFGKPRYMRWNGSTCQSFFNHIGGTVDSMLEHRFLALASDYANATSASFTTSGE